MNAVKLKDLIEADVPSGKRPCARRHQNETRFAFVCFMFSALHRLAGGDSDGTAVAARVRANRPFRKISQGFSSIPHCTAWHGELWGPSDARSRRLIRSVPPGSAPHSFFFTTATSEHKEEKKKRKHHKSV